MAKKLPAGFNKPFGYSNKKYNEETTHIQARIPYSLAIKFQAYCKDNFTTITQKLIEMIVKEMEKKDG